MSEPVLFNASNIMTTEVVTVGPDTTIADVVFRLESHRVSGLPVVDSQWRLLGVITEYDLLKSIATLDMKGIVPDFMTRDVLTVDEETSLVDLARMLVTSRVRRVPVTKYGKLVGLISRRDLIFAGNVRQQLLTELPEYDVLHDPKRDLVSASL